MPRDDSTASRIDEPVLEYAALAHETALRTCRVDPATGESCAWYHGFWLYLRALRLITTPEHHAPFLESAFGAVAAFAPRPRVLVSGAADFSLFAHVLWACRRHGADPEVTVVDVCDTPLDLNRRYAARAGVPVTTRRSDMLDYEHPGAYDAICAHSFFGRFDDAQRARLMAGWRRLLAPGGFAIAVNRVRGNAGSGRLGFGADHAQAFRANVERKARATGGALAIDPGALGSLAQEYASRHHVHPVRTADDIRRMFENGGLAVERLDEIGVAKAVDGGVSGPTTLEGARYACVIARRPPEAP